MPLEVGRCKLAAALFAAIAPCLVLGACQAGLGGEGAIAPSPARVEYLSEFKKIDAAGRGRITMDEAIAYYNARFTALDKNRDGFLDASELDGAVPVMEAKTGKELLSKLDRNSDGKVSRSEFVVIANWLFQLAGNPKELTLADVEGRMPASAANARRFDPEAIPPGMPGGRGGPADTNRW